MAQNLRAVGRSLLLPITTAALTAGIFVADAITDFEIAFPVFYTAIVLLSVGFCKKNGIVFVGAGCIALTLLADVMTANTGVSEAGVINTAISLLAITSTTFLAVKIQSAKETAITARSQLARVTRDNARRISRLYCPRGQSATRWGCDKWKCLFGVACGSAAQY